MRYQSHLRALSFGEQVAENEAHRLGTREAPTLRNSDFAEYTKDSISYSFCCFNFLRRK